MGAAASSAPAAAAAEGGGVTVGGAPRLVNFLFFSLFFSLKLFRVRVGPVCCFEGLKRGMRAAEFKPHCLRPFSLSLSLSLSLSTTTKISNYRGEKYTERAQQEGQAVCICIHAADTASG